MEIFSDEYWMNEALKEATKAYEKEEVPVGCVIVSNNRIIGKGHNLTEQLNDVTAHAEMQAITAAASQLGAKYLWECTMYITLEPCAMCAGAIYWAQPAKVIWGASDTKRGFSKSGFHLHQSTNIESGILKEASSDLLKNFFKKLRNV